MTVGRLQDTSRATARPQGANHRPPAPRRVRMGGNIAPTVCPARGSRILQEAVYREGQRIIREANERNAMIREWSCADQKYGGRVQDKVSRKLALEREVKRELDKLERELAQLLREQAKLDQALASLEREVVEVGSKSSVR